MEVGIAEARPPYVEFEVRPVEDRDASIAAGCWQGKDVDWVIITPMGSKDRIERIAEEWLEKITNDAKNGRMPSEWVSGYKTAYKMWKEGQEVPLNGTAISNWPAASPAQIKAM